MDKPELPLIIVLPPPATAPNESALVGSWQSESGRWDIRADRTATHSTLGERNWRTAREVGFCDKGIDAGPVFSCRLFMVILNEDGSPSQLSLDGETFRPVP